METENKICPLLYLIPEFDKRDAECWGEKCALFVNIAKYEVDTPDLKYVFRGCGLITDRPLSEEKLTEEEKKELGISK